MAISAMSAAKLICETSGWSVSNLQLQKILYLAHLHFMGRHGRPLINEPFEAWAYGPVVPAVYHRAKIFGADPVRNVFHGVETPAPDSAEARILTTATVDLMKRRASELVSITHRPFGAWAAAYAGEFDGPVIQDSAIMNEYQKLTAAQ